MPRKCFVLGCKNDGPLCVPCRRFLSTGQPNGSAAHHLARAAARPVYESLAIMTGAVDAWHTFHAQTDIECDESCHAIPAAKDALEAYEQETRHAR